MEKNILDKCTKKCSFKILGYDIYTILAYFILYSFIGYIIEVLFGLIIDGVIESRKSFLYRLVLLYIWTRSLLYDTFASIF